MGFYIIINVFFVGVETVSRLPEDLLPGTKQGGTAFSIATSMTHDRFCIKSTQSRGNLNLTESLSQGAFQRNISEN